MTDDTSPAVIWGQLVTHAARCWVGASQSALDLVGALVESTYQEVPVPGINWQEVDLPLTKDCDLACSELEEVWGPGRIPTARTTLTPSQLTKGQADATDAVQTVILRVRPTANTVSGDYEGAILDAQTGAALAPIRVLVVALQ
jgi:hypothetical protein